MTKKVLSIDPGVAFIGWTLTEHYLIKNDFLSNHN